MSMQITHSMNTVYKNNQEIYAKQSQRNKQETDWDSTTGQAIPHIQIHDEVDISVESDAKAEKIIEIMESAVELKVPNKVDYEHGANWGEIK